MAAYLDEHGYVVVRAVADAGALGRAEELLWAFIEESTPMRREQPATWTNAAFVPIGDPVNGILSGNGFGHAEVCWLVRTLPRVKQAFAAVWGTARLIVSFDGGNAFRPWHAPGCARHKTLGGWWHVDQGRRRRGRHSVQGLVSLREAGARTGGAPRGRGGTSREALGTRGPGAQRARPSVSAHSSSGNASAELSVPSPSMSASR